MGSGLTFNRETQWLIAVGISVGLHVGLLVLLAVGHGGGNVQELLGVEKPDQVEVSDAKPPPSPSVAEPEPAKPDAPSMAEKPKTEKPKPSSAKPKSAKPKSEKPKPKPEKPKVDKPVEPPSEQAAPTDDPLAWPDDDEKPVAEAKPGRPSAKVETHVVKRGESLSSIAKELGCPLAELAKLNGFPMRKLPMLRLGQRIKVPRRD